MSKNTNLKNLNEPERYEASSEPTIEGKPIKGKGLAAWSLGILFFVTIIFFLLDTWQPYSLFKNGFLVSITIAIFLSIIVHIILLRGKKLLAGIFTIMTIFFLSMLLVLFGLPALRLTLAHICTPPALTTENLAVYKDCVKFAKTHDEYKSIGLMRRNLVIIGNDFYSPSSLLFDEKMKASFSANDVTQMKRLLKQLDGVRCRKFQKAVFEKRIGLPSI